MADETITLTLRVAGERQIEVDRDEYEAAKAAGRVDHYLDHDLSDLDGENTVIEPDGRSYNPHEQPHGPGDDGDLEDAGAAEDEVADTRTGGWYDEATGLVSGGLVTD